MKDYLFELDLNRWDSIISPEIAREAVKALENGKVIYLPNLSFRLDDAQKNLFTLDLSPKKAKNISFNPKTQQLSGIYQEPYIVSLIISMMQRYFNYSASLLNNLCPQYLPVQSCGRTSFRPVEIRGRVAPSYRKDDTRLHVDAFPSTPVNQLRILRVFTNINPYGENRLWNLGENFADVARQFLPTVRRRLPFEAEILYAIKATRKKRSFYDHCMLQIHNNMKADLNYQQNCHSVSVNFPPGSTWIVYTDLVSHAALAGRFVLEQTYYPSLENMLNPHLSPQFQLEQQLA